MRLKNILIVAMGLLFALQIHAKQKEKNPDFSGDWVITEFFCEYGWYASGNYIFKQRGNKVWGTYTGGASAGKGLDEGKVKGIVKGNRLFIQTCSMLDEDKKLLNKCSEYSGPYYYFTKENNILKQYSISYIKYKDYREQERREKPSIFYRYRKNKLTPIKKIGNC